MLTMIVGMLSVSSVSSQTLRPEQPMPPSDADKLYYSEPLAEKTPTEMPLTRPPLSALITIDKNVDPFQIEATQSKCIGLKEVLDRTIMDNLDIGIAGFDLRARKWTYIGSYGKFLPNIVSSYSWSYVRGHARLPISQPGFPSLIKLNSPFILASAGLQWNVFEGGRNIFTVLQNRNNYRASQHKRHATINDALLEATRRYWNLVLEEGLLQIRIRAVETSERQLADNKALEENGKATRLDVLQSESQLNDDRQNLIDQQIARRNAAIQLAEYINANQGIDLEPAEPFIVPHRLISENVTAGQLLNAAIANRPELKQYREQWLAARRGINLAVAPLLPSVQLYATEYGIGQTLSDKKRGGSAASGLAAGVGSTAAASSGLASLASSAVAGRQSEQIVSFGRIGYQVNWDINGLGLTDTGNIESAKMQARSALLQSNKQLNTVTSQVRQAYANQLDQLRKVELTTARVTSSAEELRVAQLRLQNGLGKNIDVLRAQQDYVSALVQHAQAIVNFNMDQAQLLHDTGLITHDALLVTQPLQM